MQFPITPSLPSESLLLPGEPLIEQKLRETRLHAHLLPSGELLEHADYFFNLKNNPDLPLLSEEVKWQIHFAAYAYKDLFGAIHLGENFSVDHLNSKDLSALYKILHSYHKHEVTKRGKEHSIFHTHLEVLENKFKSLCLSNMCEGRKAVEELKKPLALIFAVLIDDLEDILVKAKAMPASPSLVQSKVAEVRANADNLPSGLLIRLAEQFFNLGDDPRYPILSGAVKWQLAHAASSYKDKDLVIHLDDNFSIEQLTYTELATLYRIFLSYHDLEKEQKGEKEAIFQKHLFLIEAKFEAACFSNPLEGHETIRALEQTQDARVMPLVQTLQVILQKKAPYPVFTEDPVVTTLCSFLEPGQIRGFLSSQGILKTREMVVHVQSNYSRFFTWLNELSLQEAEEKDPTMKKVALRWKSNLEHQLFTRYTALVKRIGKDFPEIFSDKFSLHHQLAIRPEGMNLMIESFKTKGSFVGNTCICNDYEVYKQGLQNISCAPDGEWYFVIRTHKAHWTFDTDHQALVFVEKRGMEIFVHIYDSGPFKMYLAAHQLTDETQKVFPQAHILSTLVVRQKDFRNCSFFVFNDLKALSRNHNIIQWHRNTAEPAKPHLPANAPANLHNVQVTKDAPLDLLKPIQSLSQIKAGLAKPVHDTLGNAGKIKKLVSTFQVLEFSEDKGNFGVPVYAYTELKNLKYRIRIVAETFNRVVSF